MTDKSKKRVREHARKHGMSYQAAWNQLEVRNDPAPMEFQAWVEHVERSGQCLTVGDVKKLKKGDRIRFLSMHRNLCDLAYCRSEPVTAVAPAQVFFSEIGAGVTYTHETGVVGRCLWDWDKKGKHVDDDFVLEIEFAPERWYPLERDGSLPAANEPDGCGGFHWEDLPSTRTHWTDYPDETKLGWRGPMLPWERLDAQPWIFTAIDLDRLAAQAILPSIRELFGLSEEDAYLSRELMSWVLVLEEVPEELSTAIQARFPRIRVLARADRHKAMGYRDSDQTEMTRSLAFEMIDRHGENEIDRASLILFLRLLIVVALDEVDLTDLVGLTEEHRYQAEVSGVLDIDWRYFPDMEPITIDELLANDRGLTLDAMRGLAFDGDAGVRVDAVSQILRVLQVENVDDGDEIVLMVKRALKLINDEDEDEDEDEEPAGAVEVRPH